MAFDALGLAIYGRKREDEKLPKPSASEWLNEEALSMNINFSQVLQDALLTKIQMK